MKFLTPITVKEVPAPATPASGEGVIYEKTDKKLYFKDSDGTETDLTSGGSGITREEAIAIALAFG